MNKEQILDYVMNSPANTNKAVLSDMLDGIGGNSDFSVATVTFNVNGRPGGNILTPMFRDIPAEEIEAIVQMPNLSEEVINIVKKGGGMAASVIAIDSVPENMHIILYKGIAMLVFEGDNVPAIISGSIAELNQKAYLIYGDCSITINE